MLMRDRPPTADFAYADGQANPELNFVSVRLRSSAADKGSGKRHIVTRSNVQLADFEDPRNAMSDIANAQRRHISAYRKS
jgi:hypothetical protein